MTNSGSTKGTPYVVVRNGYVELRRTNCSGAVFIFAHGAISAVLQGDVIVVTFKNRRMAEYRLSPSGTTALLVRHIS
jgi:hypothetical protein